MATPQDQLYRVATRIFAAIVLGFGLTILVVTIVNGGGVFSYGVLLGVVFTGLGAGRLYLSTRRTTAGDP